MANLMGQALSTGWEQTLHRSVIQNALHRSEIQAMLRSEAMVRVMTVDGRRSPHCRICGPNHSTPCGSATLRKGPLMGPTIILDKSVAQSLSPEAVQELSRYFYTVVPPVLLMESLADLSLDAKDMDGCRKRVANMAKKIYPLDCFPNVHYVVPCISNLLGGNIAMNRRPLIAGGQTVVTSDGQRGVHFGIQPENEATMRWQYGDFSEDDLAVANAWRENTKGVDLESIKRDLPKLPAKLSSIDQVAHVADDVLQNPASQTAMLNLFLRLLRCEDYICEWVHHRWRVRDFTQIRAFAPYAHHCLRVNVMFYLGMSSGVLGTRPTNVVDLEYLCYTPFSHVFCSGDKLHRQLAPMTLGADQSFIGRDELRSALTDLAQARGTDASAEPAPDSLVHQLWRKHLGTFAPQASSHPITEEQSRKTMEELRPFLDAVRKLDASRSPRPRWPR